MSKKILIIIAAVVLVAVGAAVYFLFLRGDGEEPIVLTNYSPGDVFTTTAKDGSGLIRVGMVLVLDTDDAKVQAVLTERQPQLRETILKVLRSKTREELLEEDIFDTLQKEIIAALKARFAEFEIDNFYAVTFSDYVIQ